MHDTSLKKMRGFVSAYLANAKDQVLEIIDLGAQSVEGMQTYRNFFSLPEWRYRGVDMVAGANVDMVLADPYCWQELGDNSVDVVVSGQAFEHIEAPWITMSEIARVLKPGGLVCLIAPSAGPEHRYPLDCWRIYPDGIRSLANSAKLHLVEVFTDWGLLPWQDTFAVMQKPIHNELIDQGPFGNVLELGVGRAVYREAIAGRPWHPSYYLTLVDMEEAENNIEDAIYAARIGVELHPANVELRAHLGRLLLKAQCPGAAMEHGVTLLSARNISPAAVKAASSIYKDLPNAERHLFSSALPKEPATLRRLATLSEQSEDFLLAEACRTLLLRAKPDDIEMLLLLALAQLGLGRRDFALKNFRSALRMQLERNYINRTTIIERLLGARKDPVYLEIGVERGINFFQVDAGVKLAVDPFFQIPGGYTDFTGHEFYPVQSDNFFADPPMILKEKGADVVLVDGLHNYEQSLRDVENSLRFLKSDGIIVMHDCLPASAAEALPSLDLAKAHPDFRKEWTGDVYKTILHLRAFRTDLNICVLDTDHGVGLITCGQPESSLALSAEEIAQMDFANLNVSRKELLNLKVASWFDSFVEELASKNSRAKYTE